MTYLSSRDTRRDGGSELVGVESSKVEGVEGGSPLSNLHKKCQGTSILINKGELKD